MSLAVFVLSIFLLLDKTSYQPKPRSMFSLVIPDFNKVIVATFLIHIDTVSLSMSQFFENFSMFSITHPPSSYVISLPLLYPVPDTSFVPSATLPQSLQVYTHRSCTDTGPPTDSSPMTPSSMMTVLSSPTNLPISIQKGTRSCCNLHSIYNFLTYHCLSSPYSAFVSTLSSVFVPQTVHEALSHLDWKQVMVEEMAVLYSSGTWDLVTLPDGKTPIGCC